MGERGLLDYSLQTDIPTPRGTSTDAIGIGYLLLRDDGSCTCVNNSALDFLNNLMEIGWDCITDDAKIIHIKDYIVSEDKRLFDEHVRRCCQSEEEEIITALTIQRPDGHKQRVQLNTLPRCIREYEGQKGYLTLILSLNDPQGLNDIFERLEELNLVGKIAGSVAHEVRNPLTVVRGHLQLLSWDESLQKHSEKLETMIAEIDRAVEILTELLYMSSPTVSKLEHHNINDVLNKLFQLLNAEALVNLHELIYDLNPVPDVMLDKKRIRQVVLNLVNNGFQSMENRSSLIIRTYARDGKVFFSVKDHGKGIPPGVLKKIGTPFVTTKPNGTGLGLASCYNIAAQHGAKVEIETSSEGTTFTIVFDQIS